MKVRGWRRSVAAIVGACVLLMLWQTRPRRRSDAFSEADLSGAADPRIGVATQQRLCGTVRTEEPPASVYAAWAQKHFPEQEPATKQGFTALDSDDQERERRAAIGRRAVRHSERLSSRWEPDNGTCVRCVEREVKQRPTLLAR